MTDETLFSDALAISDPVARATFLARACPDPVQRQRVAELLAAHSADGSFLTRPAGADYAGTADAPAGTGTFDPDTFDPDGTRTPAAPVGEVGEMIGGKYKLIEAIGEGGMGTVWMAQQTEPVKRAVAVKLIKAGMDSKAVLARFEAERQALAMMDHPNIAKVLDAGATPDGRPYFVMELVKGIPITQFCDGRKLTPNARMELFVQVCNAIQHAHMKGVIHRDIKPSNVLVAMYDDRPVPKVIDFGVAKATGAQLTDRTLMTGFGAVVGTPEYMSPEQASFNQLDVDTRSDVYALGVLLYELLTGSTPVDRKSLGKAALLEILRIVREVEATRPSAKLGTSDALPTISANRGIEPKKLTGLMRNELDWIVMKALEKDRTRRYDTANGFAADVQRYLSGEQVQAVPPSLGYRLMKAYRRNKTAVRVASAFALLMCAAVAVSSWLAVKATRAEATAEDRRIEAEASAKEAADNAEKADRFAWESASKATQLEMSLQRSELTAASRQVDLDLVELQSNPRVGLLRLAQTAQVFSDEKVKPKLTSRVQVNGESITIHNFVFSEQLQLREFVTAAVLTAGQEYTPLLPPITHDGQEVVHSEVSPDAKTLLTLGADGTARLWDTRTAKPIAIFRQADERVVRCGFTPDGRTVYTDDEASVARFWDSTGGKLRGTLRVDKDGRPKGYALPRADRIERRTLQVSDSRVLTQIYANERAEDQPGFPGDKWYRTNRHKSAVELWDPKTSRLIARLDGPNRRIESFEFLGDGRWVTVLEVPSTLLVFSAEDGRLRARLKHPDGELPNRLFASPSGRRVATIGYSQVNHTSLLRMWDTTTWESVPALQDVGTVISIKFLTDEMIAIQSDPFALSTWDIYRTRQAKPMTKSRFTSPSLNLLLPEGKVLRLENGRVYDTEDWKRIVPPTGRQYHPELKRFALDGRFVQAGFDLIDTSTEKSFHRGDGRPWPGAVPLLGYLPGFGIFTAEYRANIQLLPQTGHLTIPPSLLQLWAQVAVRGELGPDGEFVKWDEPTWEKKRQELAAVPPPHPDLPFPGYVATDKLHWLRTEYNDAAEKDKLRLATELLRRAEELGDKNEAVRWRTERAKYVRELAPPPREAKK